jgi:signal transduction histidine kinase
MREHDKI